MLRTVGRILPVTLDTVTLEASLEDGTRVVGETQINGCGRRIDRIILHPAEARPAPGVIESIVEADLVVIGPGSLHTSVLPNVVVDGVGKALFDSDAVVVLVANLVSEGGEAAGLDLIDHISVIEEHAGYPIVDAVLVNSQPIRASVLERYAAEGARPLSWSHDRDHRVRVLRRELLAEGPKLRHDPRVAAQCLIDAWDSLSSRGPGVDAPATITGDR